jgi:hypothetical protein
MNIQDHSSEETVFGLKILKFLEADPIRNLFDPGSGMEKFRSGIRHKHQRIFVRCRVYGKQLVPISLLKNVHHLPTNSG